MYKLDCGHWMDKKCLEDLTKNLRDEEISKIDFLN
jgi:hypothetical protein